MESQHHIIIVGSADYPIFGPGGEVIGSVKCRIFDRCWLMRELAIRDRIAVKRLGHQKSEIIVLDGFLEELTNSTESGKSISADIADMFRSKNFFDDLKGRPEDVEAIKATLISSGFFDSPEHFNEHFRRRMTAFFVECVPQVMIIVNNNYNVVLMLL